MTFVLLSALFIAAGVGVWSSQSRYRVLVTLPCIILVFPFLLDFALPLVAMRYPASFPVAVSYWLWSLSAAAGAGVAVFGTLLVRSFFGERRFSLVSLLLLCLALSFYLLFEALHHARFMTPGNRSEPINLSAIRLLDPLRDVQCDADWLLITQESPSSVRYRCPTSLILGSLTRTPFLPWPDYTEGVSQDLVRVLKPRTERTP